ncbi:MAG: ubiquinone/menaquinone biosynthesis methyltransferase [Chloroflexota bacterium]|nr:ubiquinone/menaquinone biosynthesis methyltransferase [Chloroflexota bacterium]
MTTLSGSEKARFVRSMFDAIARRYDLMNRLMTGGRDEAWRRQAVDAVFPEAVRVAIDLGAGTGDLSFALARAAPDARVLSLDFSAAMLREEDAKRRRLGLTRKVQPVLGDAMAVPAASGSADAIITAFTLRNVADISHVLRECYRLLRPGGRLAVLELTPLRTPLFGTAFRIYFHRLVPLLGGLISGRGDAYRYLPQSVQRFPDADRLQEMVVGAGFGAAHYRKLAAGTVALHVAEKPSGVRERSEPAPADVSGRTDISGRTDVTLPAVVSAAAIRPLAVHEVTEREAWNGRLSHLPHAHGMQTWEWGELRRETGWVTRRLLFEQGGVAVAAAAVQRKGRPILGVSYCPKGPALDYADAALFARVLERMAQDAREQRSLVLTVEPEAPAAGGQAVAALRGAGYRPSATQLQSRSTVLVDVRQNDDALLRGMSATWRRYVGKAGRDGVRIRQGTAADIHAFHELYVLTAEREGFTPRPREYLEHLWHHLAMAGTVDLFLAEVEGLVEAGLLAMRFGTRAWYLYGASSARARKAHAPYLLQWHTMRWARDHGCEVYDMWGAPDDPQDEADPLAGVYYFKQGFGGRHVRWVGPYDYVVTPAVYHLWNSARPRLLSIMRGRPWRKSLSPG